MALSGFPGAPGALVASFPAGSLQANCYVVAAGPGSECVIVDPGEDALDGIAEIVREHRLRPVAALLTHGHLDHVWSVAPLCRGAGIPAYVHPADRVLLSDPLRGLGASLAAMVGDLQLAEPDDVRELADGTAIELAGLSFTVDLAPGHTPGSVTFRLAGLATGVGEPVPDTLFTGDLLFAGSIGRSDLPGGDPAALMASLARVCLPLADPTAVLPGHGPATTIGRERERNPYLRELAESAAAGQSPGSGPAGRGRWQ